MGLRIFNLDTVRNLLRNDAERSSRGARETMKAGAEKIMKRSQEYTPVDEHNLEEAHEIIEIRERALHGRHAFVVTVNENHAGTRSPTVGGYIDKIHEGFYELGEKSKEKDGGSGKVGRKFMERAFTELGPEVTAEVNAAVNRGIGH